MKRDAGRDMYLCNMTEMIKGFVVLTSPIKKVVMSAHSELETQIGVVKSHYYDLEIGMSRGAGKMGNTMVQMHQIQYVESNLPAYI